MVAVHCGAAWDWWVHSSRLRVSRVCRACHSQHSPAVSVRTDDEAVCAAWPSVGWQLRTLPSHAGLAYYCCCRCWAVMMLISLQVDLQHKLITALYLMHARTRLMAHFPGLPRWASTRKIKPIRILLKQETVSGSSINWAICKSALRSMPSISRQIAMPAPYHSDFLQTGCPSCRPTNSVKALKLIPYYI